MIGKRRSDRWEGREERRGKGMKEIGNERRALGRKRRRRNDRREGKEGREEKDW